MDILKLFFEHDLRLDNLKERHSGTEPQTELSIEDFMKPDPTYSKIYLTGTRLPEERFGIDTIEHYPLLIDKLGQVVADRFLIAGSGRYGSLEQAVGDAGIGEAILISENDAPSVDPDELRVDDDSNVGHFKEKLRDALTMDLWVLYKENAHHGFDLHLFSRDNIYPRLFYPIRELVSERLRFFSINGKRIRSERKFYFETWSLDNPPHGAEEVHPETEL